MNFSEYTQATINNALTHGRSDINIADMYQGLLMFDDQNRRMVQDVYHLNVNILLPDLTWTQIMGRPDAFPAPDLNKMMIGAIDEVLDQEVSIFNARQIDLNDESARKGYIRETDTDTYKTTGPAWKNYNRMVTRLMLLEMNDEQPDTAITPDNARQYAETWLNHPLAWMDRLNRHGHCTEGNGIWRFITSLDPELDRTLATRASTMRAQWSENIADALPAPELTSLVFMGSSMAMGLGQGKASLPHIISGAAGNINRIQNELWLMRAEPMMVHSYMNNWIGQGNPEPLSGISLEFPDYIKGTRGFKEGPESYVAPFLPGYDDISREKLLALWQETRKDFRHYPEQGISKAIQWLLNKGATPADEYSPILTSDPESVPPYINDVLQRGDSKAILNLIQFPEPFYEAWAGLSDIQDIKSLTREEAANRIPALQKPQTTGNPHNMVHALPAATATPTSKPNNTKYQIPEAEFQNALKKFTTDVTERVRNEETPEITGRDHELKLITERMLSRRMRSVIITGNPGVGKSALVLGYAQRIVDGKVPDQQKNARVLEIGAEALIEDAKYRGEAEKNFRTLFVGAMERNKAGDTNIIFSMPEAHTIVGLGSSAEEKSGLEQRLKKWTTSPWLPIILDVDTENFNKTLGKDEAFVRRCELIQLGEINHDQALAALKSDAGKASAHYGVNISDKQIETVYRLTKTHLSRHPQLDTMLGIIDKSMISAKMGNEKAVKDDDILSAVAEKARLPKDLLKKDDAKTVLELASTLKSEITGQDLVMDDLAEALRIAKAGLANAEQPIGSFMFIGPTGVGKTETGRELARKMFGSEDRLIRLDMSEYMEKHSVSKLVGAPPGYVGYNQPGTLTGPVDKQPYSVVLLDEVEKAHPDVMNVFLQIMDHGKVKDATGKTIDFSKTIVIMTSNVGALQASMESEKRHMGIEIPGMEEKPVDRSKIMLDAAKQYFSPEFLNRFSAVTTFNSLTPEMMPPILNRQIKGLNQQLQDEHGFTITLSAQAQEKLQKTGFDPKNGARPLQRAIRKLVTAPLATQLLAQTLVPNKGAVYVIEDVGADFSISEQTPDLVLNRRPANTNRAPAPAIPAMRA